MQIRTLNRATWGQPPVLNRHSCYQSHIPVSLAPELCNLQPEGASTHHHQMTNTLSSRVLRMDLWHTIFPPVRAAAVTLFKFSRYKYPHRWPREPQRLSAKGTQITSNVPFSFMSLPFVHWSQRCCFIDGNTHVSVTLVLHCDMSGNTFL